MPIKCFSRMQDSAKKTWNLLSKHMYTYHISFHATWARSGLLPCAREMKREIKINNIQHHAINLPLSPLRVNPETWSRTFASLRFLVEFWFWLPPKKSAGLVYLLLMTVGGCGWSFVVSLLPYRSLKERKHESGKRSGYVSQLCHFACKKNFSCCGF